MLATLENVHEICNGAEVFGETQSDLDFIKGVFLAEDFFMLSVTFNATHFGCPREHQRAHMEVLDFPVEVAAELEAPHLLTHVLSSLCFLPYVSYILMHSLTYVLTCLRTHTFISSITISFGQVEAFFNDIFNCFKSAPLPIEEFFVPLEFSEDYNDVGFTTKGDQSNNKWKCDHEDISTTVGLPWPLASAKQFRALGFPDRQSEIIALADAVFPSARVDELVPFHPEHGHEKHWHFMNSNHSVERSMQYKAKDPKCQMMNPWRRRCPGLTGSSHVVMRYAGPPDDSIPPF